VISIHQRYRRTDGQTDRQTDVKRRHDRSIAKAWSGKNHTFSLSPSCLAPSIGLTLVEFLGNFYGSWN